MVELREGSGLASSRGIGEFRERVTGALTIVASGVPATYLLPETVVAFQRAHPGVHVNIVPGNSAQTMDALRSHRAELGVVGGFAAAPEIEAEPLVEEAIVVVGAPGIGGRWMSRSVSSRQPAVWKSPQPGCRSSQATAPSAVSLPCGNARICSPGTAAFSPAGRRSQLRRTSRFCGRSPHADGIQCRRRLYGADRPV